jgi:two-component system OmpR family sensor kinase
MTKLGLAIVDSVMRQIGGSLTLISPVMGRGTGFEARLVFPEPT